MSLILNFTVAFIATLAIAGLSRWIAGMVASVQSSRVASFAAAIGYAVGKYSFARPLGSDVSEPAAAVLGAVAALVIVWFVLFKRSESMRDGSGS